MKVVSYADQGIINFYDVLHSSWSFQEYNMEALSITNQYKGHYKNRLYLDGDWEYFNASQARVSLYESGNVVKELVFNATGSKHSDWFQKSRLKSSPWNDIWSEPQNYFSVPGYCWRSVSCRFFYINRNFGQCHKDFGWLMYTDIQHCDFELGQRVFTVQYSKFQKKAKFEDYDQVGIADVLAVFLK